MGDLTKRKFMSLDEMFGEPANEALNSEAEKKTSNSEDVLELPVYKCIPYHNHKFKVKRSNYEEFVQSIQEFGVISPILVRPYGEVFEIIAGHTRHQGSIDAGKITIPAIVRELNDNEAWAIVSETNIHQSSMIEMSYSERAEILYDYHEALKSQGKRNDILNEVRKLLETAADEELETSRHSGEKSDSGGKTGKEFDLSPRTVSRYLRIYTLDIGLKELLDNGTIPFLATVELSYLSAEHQEELVDVLNENALKIDRPKAELLRKLEKQKKLDGKSILEILQGKNALDKKKTSVLKGIKIKPSTMKKYFKPEQSKAEVEEIIEKALKLYYENQ